MKKIYFASKLHHAQKWSEGDGKKWRCVSRWVKNILIGVQDTPENCVVGWQENIEDIEKADYVVVYAEPGEKLRGGLVEAGVALGMGIPVVIIGDHEDYGTWKYHPLVYRLETLDQLKPWYNTPKLEINK